jgi:hypothetical protein
MLSLGSRVTESGPHDINHMAICRPSTEGAIRVLTKGVIRMFNKSRGIHISPLYHSTEFLASQRGLKELWSTTAQETNICHKFCNKIKYLKNRVA